MTRHKNSAGAVLATLACLFLAACETLGIGTKSDATVNAASILERVPEVENSPKSPCWQQRQIATQRAYIDSVVKGKPMTYHADPCKPVPASEPEPKTS
jgi:hypothetical protein